MVAFDRLEVEDESSSEHVLHITIGLSDLIHVYSYGCVHRFIQNLLVMDAPREGYARKSPSALLFGADVKYLH